MRKFLSLPQEKQNRIVSAAMDLFGEVGYKKAYVSEIASAARISKALVFHYFVNKKGLYSYLVYYTGKIVLTEAQESRDTLGKDFFERVLITIRFRLSIMNRYPAMHAFIESVYKEDDPEVSADVERLLAIAKDMHSKITMTADEAGMLSNGVNSTQVADLIEKYSEGIIAGWDNTKSIDEVMLEVTDCMHMLKGVLYM